MRYHRSTDVTWELADDRAVILDAAGGTLITLNPVGTLVWRHLDRPRAPAEIAECLATEFPDVAGEELQADIRAFLAQLCDASLVVAAESG